MNTRLFLPLVPFLLLGSGACRTVQYDDPDKVETLPSGTSTRRQR